MFNSPNSSSYRTTFHGRLVLVLFTFLLATILARTSDDASIDYNACHERKLSLLRRASPGRPKESSQEIVIKTPAEAAPYVKPPPVGRALLWSGIDYEKAQAFSRRNGYQTLEQSVPTEILHHPDSLHPTRRVPFWAALSQAFSDKVATANREVTILLRPPNKKLNGPSDPFQDGRLVTASDAGRIEVPRMKKSNVKIYAIHPDVPGTAGTDKYELWPNDQGYVWQQKHKLGGHSGAGASSVVDQASPRKAAYPQKSRNRKRASLDHMNIETMIDLDDHLRFLVRRYLQAIAQF